MQRPPAQTSNPGGNTTKITAEPTRNSNRKQSSMATKQDWQRNPRRTGGSLNPSGNTAKLTAEPTRNSLWKQTGRLVRRPSPAEALLPQEAPQEAQKGSKKGRSEKGKECGSGDKLESLFGGCGAPARCPSTWQSSSVLTQLTIT